MINPTPGDIFLSHVTHYWRSNEEINGGDFVEYIGELLEALKVDLTPLPQD